MRMKTAILKLAFPRDYVRRIRRGCYSATAMYWCRGLVVGRVSLDSRQVAFHEDSQRY